MRPDREHPQKNATENLVRLSGLLSEDCCYGTISREESAQVMATGQQTSPVERRVRAGRAKRWPMLYDQDGNAD